MWRFLLMVIASVAVFCDASRAGEPTSALTVQQRAQVRQLLADFRRTRNDPDRRTEIVNEVLSIGGPAVSQLRGLIDPVLRGKLKSYATRFKQVASARYRAQLAGGNIAEVQQLRMKVLSLRQRDDLTEAMIVEVGQPGIERLQEILIVSRKAVLEVAALRAQRDTLLPIGRHWQRCREYLAAKGGGPMADSLPDFEEFLQQEEEVASQVAMPTSNANRSVMMANAQLTSKLDEEEYRAIVACNLMRNLLGLTVLKIDLKLCASARDHSQDMERLDFFSHDSPVLGKKDPWQRARRFGTTAAAENIFRGQTDGRRVHLGWFRSPGHHKNLLADRKRIGVGRSGVFFTQLFGN